MMIDSVVQVVRDLVATLAAITGATVAILGLQTWQRQLRGDVDLEVSRSVLRAAYKMRDAIKSVRNPFHSMNEIAASRKEEEVESGNLLRNYERSLYTKRWEEVLTAGQELRVAEIEGEVLWGEGFTKALEPLTTCVRDLSISLGEYLRYKEMEGREHSQQAIMEEDERTLKARSGKVPDAFEQRVNEAINTLESFIRPKMRLRLLRYGSKGILKKSA